MILAQAVLWSEVAPGTRQQYSPVGDWVKFFRFKRTTSGPLSR